MTVLTFGEVLWDVIEGCEHLGGAPFNVAAHLACCGARAFCCTAVGNDHRGRRVLNEMDRLGVDRVLVGVDKHRPTGYVTVSLSAGGQPSYEIHEHVAWDAIELDDAQSKVLDDLHFDAFCFGTLSQRSATSRSTLMKLLSRQIAPCVLFDVNLRQHYYSAEVLRESLKHATILKLNDAEVSDLALLLFGEPLSEEAFARRVAADYQLQAVLITQGGEGCAVLHDERYERIAGNRVQVVDTVGAGDAFSAGFLYRYCHGALPNEAAKFANELGAYVAAHHGAIPEYDASLLGKLASL